MRFSVKCSPTVTIFLSLIFKSLYSIFDKVVYSADGMEVVQDSFFAKGTNLLVTGIKRGSTFVPKVYKSTGSKAILKINLTEDRHFKNFEEKGKRFEEIVKGE